MQRAYIQSEIASHLKLKNTPSLTFYLDEGKEEEWSYFRINRESEFMKIMIVQKTETVKL